MEKLNKFEPWVDKMMPTVYSDALAYYNLLEQMVKKINEIIDQNGAVIEYADGTRKDLNSEHKKLVNHMNTVELWLRTTNQEQKDALMVEHNKLVAHMNAVEAWLRDEALPQNVSARLNELLNDGTLASIINTDVFNMKADQAFVDGEIARLDGEDENINRQLAQKATTIYPTTTVFEQRVDFASQYFRIPFMTVTNQNTIIAGGDVRYHHGDDFGRIDIGISRSIDGGKTFIDKQIIIKNNATDPNFSRAMDGTILYDKINDRIYVFAVKLDSNELWFRKTDTSNWDMVYVYSDDDGITWSNPTSIKSIISPFTDRVNFLAGVGSGIQMNNGTLILPVQVSKLNLTPFDMQSGIVYSTDGVTWQMSETLVPEYSSECNIVEYEDGKLLLNARSDYSGKRALYKTEDMGVSWQALTSNFIGNSNALLQPNSSMGSMIKTTLENGKTKLLYSSPHNNFTDYVDGRRNVSLMSSLDNGQSWDMVASIFPDLSHGYSCLVEKDGHLYVLLEIMGDLVFKDISKLLTLVEKDKKIIKEVEHSSVTVYVSAIGDDNNSGVDLEKPYKTLSKALSFPNDTVGGILNIQVLTDLPDRCYINGFKDLLEVNIVGVGGVKTIGRLQTRNCDSIININNIKLTGGFNSDIGHALLKSNEVILTNCELDSESRTILQVNGTKVTLVNTPINKGQTIIQDGINVINGSHLILDRPIFNGSGFRNGVNGTHSIITITNTLTADSSVVGGSTSIITNTEKPINTLNTCQVKSHLLLPVTLATGWQAHFDPNYTARHRVDGKTSTLTGMITANTGVQLTRSSVVATLSKLVPKYEQIRQTFGYTSNYSVIPITLLLRTNGEIVFNNDVSAITYLSLDGISFVNNG